LQELPTQFENSKKVTVKNLYMISRGLELVKYLVEIFCGP
jgi:hypothetical protein